MEKSKKGTFPFKWKVIRSSHIRLVARNKRSFKKQPFKKQIFLKKVFCLQYENAKLRANIR